MKNNTNKVLCKCKEWVEKEDLCTDGTCVYCEHVDFEPEDDEPTLDEYIQDLGVNLADGYVDYEDDDEI